MKKFFSCLLTAAMVSAAASVPVLAAESGEFTEDLYYRATSCSYTYNSDNPDKKASINKENVIYHVGNGAKEGPGANTDVVGFENLYDNQPNCEITLSFYVPAAGVYGMESVMVDVFRKQLGEYELYINGVKYEMTPKDGEPVGEFTNGTWTAASHSGRQVQGAQVVAEEINLTQGVNNLTLKQIHCGNDGTSDTPEQWSLWIYDMAFKNTDSQFIMYDARTGKGDYRNFESSNFEKWSKDSADWEFNPWFNIDHNNKYEYESIGAAPSITYVMKVPKTGNYYPIVYCRNLAATIPSAFDMTIGGKKFNVNNDTMAELYTPGTNDGCFVSGGSIKCYRLKDMPIKLEAGDARITFEVPNALVSDTFWVGIRAFGLAATEDPVTPAADDITAKTEISGVNDDGETYKVGMKFADSFNPKNYKYIVFTAGKEQKGNEIANIKALSGIDGDTDLAIILDKSPSRDVTVTVTNKNVSIE